MDISRADERLYRFENHDISGIIRESLCEARRRILMSTKSGSTTTFHFGKGEFEKHSTPYDDATDSISDLRSRFLQLCGELKPSLVDQLQELLPLYSRVPLFCFEADPGRTRVRGKSRRNRQLIRTDWATRCRPTWYFLEESWKARNEQQPFEISFPANFSRWIKGDWEEPWDDCSRHRDPNIELFIKRLTQWSFENDLDHPWCRYHAFETLDLWRARDDLREARIWQLLPSDLRNGTTTIWDAEIHRGFSKRPLPSTHIQIDFDLAEYYSKPLAFYPLWGFKSEVDEALEKLTLPVKKFVDEITNYLKLRERDAGDLGFVRSKAKKNDEHLRWFAQVQMGTASYKELADAYNAKHRSNYVVEREAGEETKTVRRAVNEMSKLLNLKIRRSVTKRGRRS